MKKGLIRKGLVLSVIVLFIGVSALSSVSSKDISVSDEEKLEYDVELDEDNEIKPLDAFDEIISFVWGYGYVVEGEHLGYIVSNEHIDLRDYRGEIIIQAITRTPGHRFYSVNDVTHLIIEHFYGFVIPSFDLSINTVFGIAIGNINW